MILVLSHQSSRAIPLRHPGTPRSHWRMCSEEVGFCSHGPGYWQNLVPFWQKNLVPLCFCHLVQKLEVVRG